MKRSTAIATALGVLTVPRAAGAAAAQRIVSLIPSVTEDLFAIGAGGRVVAVSQYSDYPPAATKLPQVASFSNVDAEKIVALRPDLVVGIVSQTGAVEPLRRMHVPLVLLHDDAFKDIFANVTQLGALTGQERGAAELERRLRARTAALTAHIDTTRRKSVFVVLGAGPIETVGRRSYITTLIEMAGGRNAAHLNVAYADYSPEALLSDQPDLIIADPAVGLRSVLSREPWRSLNAVRRGAVSDIPNPGVVLRPGPRYNDGLAWLIATIRKA